MFYRYRPHYPNFERIPHYYGDTVRVLFIVVLVGILAGAPLYTTALTAQLPFVVIGALVLITLAGLTNPQGHVVMIVNAVVSAFGILLFETWALLEYQNGTLLEFVVREAIAFIFMFAFYFSLKTVRAMYLGKLGKEPDLSDFSDGDIPEEETCEPESSSRRPFSDGLGKPAAPDDLRGMD